MILASPQKQEKYIRSKRSAKLMIAAEGRNSDSENGCRDASAESGKILLSSDKHVKLYIPWYMRR